MFRKWKATLESNFIDSVIIVALIMECVAINLPACLDCVIVLQFR